jgi:hypothetical protein
MKVFKVIASVAFLFLIAGLGSVMAQPGPGPVFNPVPLDGGISLLLAAGAAYGVKKAVDSRKSK